MFSAVPVGGLFRIGLAMIEGAEADGLITPGKVSGRPSNYTSIYVPEKPAVCGQTLHCRHSFATFIYMYCSRICFT